MAIGDTFVEASDTGLASHTATGPNGGFGWALTGGTGTLTVVASSDRLVVASGSLRRARAESDLGSADHYAEWVAHVWQAGGANRGPAVRYDPAADSFYVYLIRDSTPQHRLFKVTNGSLFQLATFSEALPAVPFTVRLEANGSSLEGFINGVSKVSASDGGFATQLRTGLLLDGAGTEIDDFEAGDLVGDDPANLSASVVGDDVTLTWDV